MKKGTYGYIEKRKLRNLINTLVMIGLMVAIIGLGYFLNNRSTKNIFTVLGILFVLPATRHFIGYITLLPYKTPDKEKYDQVLAEKTDQDFLLSDLALSSTKRVMGLSFLYIKANKVLAFNEKGEKNRLYVQEYLEEVFSAGLLDYKLEIYDDYKMFLQEIKGPQVEAMEDVKEVINIIKTISI